jgi:hypothetical protein
VHHEGKLSISACFLITACRAAVRRHRRNLANGAALLGKRDGELARRGTDRAPWRLSRIKTRYRFTARLRRSGHSRAKSWTPALAPD